MDTGKAMAIFEQIESNKYTETEKIIAISRTLKMETHNCIKKDAILKAFRWFINGEPSMCGDERFIKAKKIKYPKDEQEPYRCPTCGIGLGFYTSYNGDLETTRFCRNCGQKLCK